MSSKRALKNVPKAKPSAGFLNMVLAGIENEVPKNILKTPIAKMKKLRKKVRASKEIMRDLAFLMNVKKTVMIRNSTEKFPRNAFNSPKNVWVKGAI